MSVFTKHAFISHSSQDRDVAAQICDVLEGEGLSCWIAPRDIDPGTPYDEEITRGINTSQTFILVLSDAANESPHVKRELMMALDAGHAVYPIRIQEVMPGPRLEYLLVGIHWVDAWAPPLEDHLQRLAQIIAAHDPSHQPPRMPPRKRRKPRRGRFTFALSLALLAILACAAIAIAIYVARSGSGIDGAIAHLTSQVSTLRDRLSHQGTADLPGLAPQTPAGTTPPPAQSPEEIERRKQDRHQTLLAQAKDAESKGAWQQAINAYEAAISLIDDPGARQALARVSSRFDMEQVASRRQADHMRSLAEAERAETRGDFVAAQVAYERAAADAPDDQGRVRARERARKTSDAAAAQKRRSALDELMRQVAAAQERKDWQGAIDVYDKALAAMPDEAIATQIRARKIQLLALKDRSDPSKPPPSQVVMLTWVSNALGVVKQPYPASQQILNNSGGVIADVYLAEVHNTELEHWRYVTRLILKSGKEKGLTLCDFVFEDPVGVTRVAKANGLIFSAKVLDNRRLLLPRRHADGSTEMRPDDKIGTITLQVTAQREDG